MRNRLLHRCATHRGSRTRLACGRAGSTTAALSESLPVSHSLYPSWMRSLPYNRAFSMSPRLCCPAFSWRVLRTGRPAWRLALRRSVDATKPIAPCRSRHADNAATRAARRSAPLQVAHAAASPDASAWSRARPALRRLTNAARRVCVPDHRIDTAIQPSPRWRPGSGVERGRRCLGGPER